MKRYRIYTLWDGMVVYEWETDSLDRAVKAYGIMRNRATRQTFERDDVELTVILDDSASHQVLADLTVTAHAIHHHTLIGA